MGFAVVLVSLVVGSEGSGGRKLCLWIYPLVWSVALMYFGGFCGLKPPKWDHVTFPLILKQVSPSLKRFSPLPWDTKTFSLKSASHPKPNSHNSLPNISPKPISYLFDSPPFSFFVSIKPGSKTYCYSKLRLGQYSLC